MTIAPGADAHVPPWAVLRHDLWPDETVEDHEGEIVAMLARPDAAGFVATLGGRVVGFAEASLRRDYVNGCDTTPVAFLEGLYVAPAHRRHGVARALVDTVADWARTVGCSEMASDAELDNAVAHAVHEAAGFAETERVVYFRRDV